MYQQRLKDFYIKLLIRLTGAGVARPAAAEYGESIRYRKRYNAALHSYR